MTGKVLEEHPVSVTDKEVERTILSFLGDQEQIPPMYSALDSLYQASAFKIFQGRGHMRFCGFADFDNLRCRIMPWIVMQKYQYVIFHLC